MTAYGVLSRGLLGGSKPIGASDFRAHLPRFSPQNLEVNQRLVVDALGVVATRHGATRAQRAIA